MTVHKGAQALVTHGEYGKNAECSKRWHGPRDFMRKGIAIGIRCFGIAPLDRVLKKGCYGAFADRHAADLRMVDLIGQSVFGAKRGNATVGLGVHHVPAACPP